MVKEPETDLSAFGDALSRALAVRGMTQKALGEALGGLSQAAVAGWVTGLNPPSTPAMTFKIEEVLELPPGHLSRLLGYLPASAIDAPGANFEETIAADPLLDDTQKRMILALYREATTRKPGGRGRPKKS